MTKQVALLRGINVGGHKKVPMKELKNVLESSGFSNVKTLLASGNVVFESGSNKTSELSNILEAAFGFAIPTLVLPFSVIEELVAAKPFDKVSITPKTRLYVTFLKEAPATKLKTPYTPEGASFVVTGMNDHCVMSVLDLDKDGTLDLMKFLEKEFGKEITTRNYNTVEKIAKL